MYQGHESSLPYQIVQRHIKIPACIESILKARYHLMTLKNKILYKIIIFQ